MNKKTLANLGYALAIFLYIDVAIFVAACAGKNVIENQQIKQEAEEIFNTPDLSSSGLEELEQAIQMDLADLEKSFQKNS